ncbi:MAG: DUF1963 domain-containing protein [Pseudomonadota bacterium]
MTNSPTEPTQTEIDAMLFRCRRPGILLNKTLRPDDPGLPGCWLGGRPTLPPEIEWPVEHELPMRFLAQIDLSQIPPVAFYPEMPRTGTLFFFYEPVFSDYMNDPAYGHRVIYVDAEVSHHKPREVPPMPEVAREYDEYDEAERREYSRWHFDLLPYETFAVHWSIPHEVSVHVIRTRMAAIKALKASCEDRLTPVSKFSPHSVFGTCRRDEPQEGRFAYRTGEPFEPADPLKFTNPLVRLLAIFDDFDLRVGLHTASIGFWISRENLRARNFEATLLIGDD